MIPEPEKNRIDSILDAVSKAAEGDYSPSLDFASPDNQLGRLADAVNRLLAKTDKRIASMSRFLGDLTGDAGRYRNIIDSIEESYFETNLKGNLHFFNERVIRELGYTEEELQGMHFHNLLDPSCAQKVYDAFHRVFLTGRPAHTFEFEILKKNKEILDVESSISLLRDEAGNPVGFRGIVRNVSQRKADQEALRQSEEKYRNILENMEETYLESDLKGNFKFFNDSLCRMLGYTRAEMHNMNYRRISPPGSQEKIYEMFNDIYRTGETGTFVDHAVMAKDGSLIILEMTISLMRSAQGEPTGFRGLSRNVTDRLNAEKKLKENELRLRLISHNIHDIIWTVDFDLNFTYISPSIKGVLGFSSEEIMPIPVKAFMPQAKYQALEKMLSEELAKEREGRQDRKGKAVVFEMEMLRKDGEAVWVEISADFNRDESGNPFEILGVSREITERKKVEKALAESERRYQMIIDNLRDTLWTMDFNLQYTYLSPSILQLTGYTIEEIKQIPLHQQLTPASLALVEKVIAEEFITDDPSHPRDPDASRTMELEIIRKDGSLLWEEITVTFNKDDAGNPVGIIGVTRDISDRKKAEAVIQESEKRYRLIAENMTDIVWTMTPDLRFLYVSPSSTRVMGYTPEKICNTPVDQLLTPDSFAHATGILANEMALDAAGNNLTPNRAITIEIEAIPQDAGSLWLEITGTFSRDKNGSITEMLIVGKDITERKKVALALQKSEKRYRMIVENMREIIWTTDLQLQYTYVSPSCLWLTGYTPEELANIPLDQLLTPDTLALAAATMAEELALEFSGTVVDTYRSRTLEQELCHKDGGSVWLEVTAIFTHDDTGKASGMLMAGRDITARKKAEAEKNKLETQLIQAQKMEMVGRLAGGVAHDFNNMLSVILGYVDLAKLRLARQHPVLKDIAEIEKAAIRSRDITAQLLAFSRKQIIEPRIIDLNDMVVHSQKALIRLIGEDIEMKIIPGEKLWAIKFDPSQVEQILINLAVNARDAMPQGGKLTLETANIILDQAYCDTHVGLTPGNYIRLSVSDNGTGMSKEVLQNIFEPFFTTKEEGKGTGLGLATVYGIVKQNNGYIAVYSEPGHGTTFTIYLPGTTDVKEVEDESGQELEFTGTGNILLVEDDVMVLQITQGMLEAMGYTVTVAGKPLDAITLCANPQTAIDLVITDVIMPVMSGKDLRDKILEIRPGLKVLFMSGYTADVIAHHGVLEPGVLFLQKPFSIKSLALKVSEALAAT